MRYMMKKALFAVLVLSALVLAACSGDSHADVDATLAPVPVEFAGKTNPLGVDAAAKGADVFKAYCEVCHGQQGHGDGPAAASLSPKPKNLAALQVDVGDDYLYWRISTGREGTAMIAWKGILTDEQIWQVIAFVRTLK
jgi:mono/diheme cytochrome c family protein